MDAVNILVLPALAALVLLACGVMAWFIFRPAPIEKVRGADAGGKMAQRRAKKAL